jgi:hypothetical protein
MQTLGIAFQSIPPTKTDFQFCLLEQDLCKTNFFMSFPSVPSFGIDSSVNLGMPRNEHFLPRNSENLSESFPRNFFGIKFRCQPLVGVHPPSSPAWTNFSIMMECICSPESGRCHSLYFVMYTIPMNRYYRREISFHWEYCEAIASAFLSQLFTKPQRSKLNFAHFTYKTSNMLRPSGAGEGVQGVLSITIRKVSWDELHCLRLSGVWMEGRKMGCIS